MRKIVLAMAGAALLIAAPTFMAATPAAAEPVMTQANDLTEFSSRHFRKHHGFFHRRHFFRKHHGFHHRPYYRHYGYSYYRPYGYGYRGGYY